MSPIFFQFSIMVDYHFATNWIVFIGSSSFHRTLSLSISTFGIESLKIENMSIEEKCRNPHDTAVFLG